MKKQPSNSFFDHLSQKITNTVDGILEYFSSLSNRLQKFKIFKKGLKSPYLKLIRLDKPTGIWLCLLPALWTLAAIDIFLWKIIIYTLLFTTGAFLARSIGCIINDVWDKEFDKKVERTKSRPLASGKLSSIQAMFFAMILLVPTLLIILTLSTAAKIMTLITAILIAIYPLMKRILELPQIFLGFVMNAGVFIVWFNFNTGNILVPVVIYSASVLWTIAYDTVYAIQDINDDVKIGVKSSALVWQENSIRNSYLLYKIFCILLAILGLYLKQNFIYFILLFLAWQFIATKLELVDVNDKKSLATFFQSNAAFGFIVYLGFLFSA